MVTAQPAASDLVKPTLSVVLPNYNHAALITRALEALLAQERPPDEIVIVDDGSTDDSLSVIERLAAREPRIRVIVSGKNMGAIAALNRGLQAVRSKYVYFGAADDWVAKGFFATAIEKLDAHPNVGLMCGEAVVIDSRTGQASGIRPPVRPRQSPGIVTPDRVRRLLAKTDNWILTGGTVFRRDAVMWAGGFDPKLRSFADGFLARKVALAHGFYYTNQIVLTWLVDPDGLSRRTALDVESAREMLKLISVKLASDPIFPLNYAKKYGNRWRFASARLAMQQDPMNRPLLFAMGARNAVDRFFFRFVWAVANGRTARLASLAWLWLRLRPTTLTGLGRTAAVRRREHLLAARA